MQIKRPDNFPQNEVEDEKREVFMREYKKMEEDLIKTITGYFPEATARHRPPNLERYLDKLNNDYEANDHFQDKVEEEIFDWGPAMAGISIRLVDDFLDEYYWPKLRNKINTKKLDHTNESIVSSEIEKITSLLNECYILASSYDPNLPRDIIDLPLIELRMELTRDQETFDKYIIDLIENKSKDMEYLRKIFVGRVEGFEWSEKLQALNKKTDSLHDIFRDASFVETHDFNIFNHMKIYNLHPGIFLSYIEKAAMETEKYLTMEEFGQFEDRLNEVKNQLEVYKKILEEYG